MLLLHTDCCSQSDRHCNFDNWELPFLGEWETVATENWVTGEQWQLKTTFSGWLENSGNWKLPCLGDWGIVATENCLVWVTGKLATENWLVWVIGKQWQLRTALSGWLGNSYVMAAQAVRPLTLRKTFLCNSGTGEKRRTFPCNSGTGEQQSTMIG